MFHIQIHLDLFLSHGCLLVAVNGHCHGVLPIQNTDNKLLALLLSLLQPHTIINTHCTSQDLSRSTHPALCKNYTDQHTLHFARLILTNIPCNLQLTQINTHFTLQDLPWSTHFTLQDLLTWTTHTSLCKTYLPWTTHNALCKTYPDQHTLHFVTYPDQHTAFCKTYPDKHTMHFARLTWPTHPAPGKTYPEQHAQYLTRLTLNNTPSTWQDLSWTMHPVLAKTYLEQCTLHLARPTLNNVPSTWQDLPWIHSVLGKNYPEHAQY